MNMKTKITCGECNRKFYTYSLFGEWSCGKCKRKAARLSDRRRPKIIDNWLS